MSMVPPPVSATRMRSPFLHWKDVPSHPVLLADWSPNSAYRTGDAAGPDTCSVSIEQALSNMMAARRYDCLVFIRSENEIYNDRQMIGGMPEAGHHIIPDRVGIVIPNDLCIRDRRVQIRGAVYIINPIIICR